MIGYYKILDYKMKDTLRYIYMSHKTFQIDTFKTLRNF